MTDLNYPGMNYSQFTAPASRRSPKGTKSRSPHTVQHITEASTPPRPSSSQKLKHMWIYSSAQKKNVDKKSPTRIITPLRHQSLRSRTSTPVLPKLTGGPARRSVDHVSQTDLSSYLHRKESEHTDITVKRLGINGLDAKDKSETKRRKRNEPEQSPGLLDNEPDMKDADLTSPAKQRAISEVGEEFRYSQPDLKQYLKQMSEEIMRYEMRLASLHGRMAELTRENERLRNDDKYRLICTRLADKLVAETKEKLYRKSKDKIVEGKDCSKVSDDTTSGFSGPQHTEDFEAGNHIRELPINEVGKSQGLPRLSEGKSEDCRKSSKALETLEKRILERLDKYEEALSEAEDKMAKRTHSVTLLKSESPFVEDLRDRLLCANRDLARVRSYTTTRLSNLKIALEKEQVSCRSLQKQNGEYKETLNRWETFGKQAQAYFPHYTETINRQKGTIEQQNSRIEEQKATIEEQKNANIELKTRLTQFDQSRADEPIPYRELASIVESQKKDIGALNQYLHDEKVKSRNLVSIVEQLRNVSTKKSQQMNLPQDDVRSTEIEERHRMEIRTLHKMYNSLLNNVEMSNKEGKEVLAENGNDQAVSDKPSPSVSPQIKKEHSPEDLLGDSASVTLESPKSDT